MKMLKGFMKLSDKAYNTLTLLRRASFLMNDYPNNVEDDEIETVCNEIANYLKEGKETK